MRILAQRIDGDQACRRFAGAVGQTGFLLMVQQSSQAAHGQAAQAFTLGGKPLLEAGRFGADPVEQIAAIQRQRRPQRVGRAQLDATLELGHVQRERVGCQRHRLHVGGDQGVGAFAQRPAHGRERLAQAGARLHLATVGPQQRGQPVASVRPPHVQREIGKQAARLAGGEDDRFAVRGVELEAAEQLEAHAGHGKS